MRKKGLWLATFLTLSFMLIQSPAFIRTGGSAGEPPPHRPPGQARELLIMLPPKGFGVPVFTMSPAGATFVVTTTGDNLDNNSPTPGSLRAAIRAANLNPGADTIEFNIFGAGPHTINVGAGLPDITDTVTIDGYSQPGASPNTLATGTDATLKIEIQGHAPSQGSGLVIAANDCVVQGLVIHGFNHAVRIDGARTVAGASGNVVRGNYIGTNLAGTAVSPDFFNGAGNLGGGVLIDSGGFKPDNTPGAANNNLVGGTTPAARNLISGNGSFGVRVSQNIGAATGNVVRGNYIGTNAAGTAALGGGSGISLASSGNTIGGTDANARNVISGNNYNSLTSNGISICCNARNNLVQGNFIGTDATGAVAVPNAVNGVDINGAGTIDNTVGGSTAAARNVISGNGVMGVAIGNTSGNKVQGNFIGTDATGAAALGNGFNGVYVAGALSAVIGGVLPGEGNVISANLRGGVDIASDNTVVQGNFIGTEADGVSPLGNPQYGVRVSGAGNLIGGRASGAGNLIAYSRLDSPFSDAATGVIIFGPNTNTTAVGNSIHSNEGLGLDLSRDGLTANDVCDGDAGNGANNKLQNYPLLTSAASGGGTNIQGTLDSQPGATYTLDFYANDACDDMGFGEGQTYLGSANVVTDANCGGSFTAALPVAVPAGRFLTATATDPSGNTSEFSACVQVTLANSPPDAVNDTVTTNEDRPVTISPLANDTDPDGDALAISSFTQGSNGSVADNGDGTLTYTPSANFNGSDSFAYSVSDGNGGTDTATVAVNVSPVSDPPDAVDDTASTNEDAAVSVDVLANDANGDCGALIVTAVTQGAHGSVVVNPDGTLTYTPNANFNGADSFGYTIGCGQGQASSAPFKSVPSAVLLNALRAAAAEESDEAEVAVSVSPVNDAPDAVDDAATTQEGTAVAIDVLANDTDRENDAFIVTAFTQGANGSVTSNPGGTLTYTPHTSFSGTDSFTYTIGDGHGGADTATVTVTVNAVSAPPDAVDDEATTDEDTNVTINMRANDSNGNCGAVSVSDFTQPSNGTVAFINASSIFVYFPAANFNGTDSFTYTLRCAGGDNDTATVTVTVNPVNDPPRALNDTYETDEDTPLNIVAPGVLANDGDVDGDALTATLVPGPAIGPLAFNPDGSFTYTPPLHRNGPVTFTYSVSDGHGGTATATVTINIAPVNDPPAARDDSVTIDEDRSTLINVLANDVDFEGEALKVLSVTQPANGSASVPNFTTDSVGYSPNRDFNGEDSFTYTVRDASGNTSTATVRVTVKPINDAPVAVVDSYVLDGASLTVDVPGVMANDSDVEGDALTASLVTGPAHGALTLNPDGSFTYTPNANFPGCDSFDYRVHDGHSSFANGFSNNATVTITNSPATDPLANSAPASTQSAASSAARAEGSDADSQLFSSASDGTVKKSHASAGSSADAAPSWARTDNLNSARVFHTATLLRDGRVLVVGGTSHAGKDFFNGKSFLKTAEVHDPAAGTWRRAGDLNTARAHHTATLLPDGKVLVAGGVGQNGVPLGTAEVYDPATGSWARTPGSLGVARAGHTATLVPQPSSSGGKVLVAGGVGDGLSALDSAEVYDHANGTWANARSLTAGRWAHTATFLRDGRVLVTGGNGASGTSARNTAELYDPSTNTWTRTAGVMSAARGHHTATLLRDGRVLLSGGLGPNGILGGAEIYDPATGAFTTTSGRLATGRWLHTATLLRDGRVLVAGGNTDNNFGRSATNAAEIYDPATDIWTRAANLVAGRHSQTATLLHNNKVLAAGGIHAAATLNKAELYDTLDTRRLFSTCAGVTVTQFHGEGFHGNSRIARIQNGKVPCMHAETGETAECVFATDGASAGLMWVEAVDGQYAKTGQAVTPLGEPNGEWIVAARVNDDGTVPCVAPSGRDTAGRIAEGTELATQCMVEDMNTDYNSSSAIYGWNPMWNYATLEVCSGNAPGSHPDGAFLTRTITSCSGLVTCYLYNGAALNDTNGTERDSTGMYFPGEDFCHMLVTDGYEVPAAKRPATRSLPAPGSVNVNTNILWRPVNPNVRIAN